MEKPQDNQLIFCVSDFIAIFNQTIEYSYPSVAIEGEVASFKVNQGKYVFFDLKDSSGSVGCFMSLFQLRTPIEDGMKVIVMASPKLTAWGKFSLTVRSIRPSGEGSLKKSYDLLKTKLEKEGLFAIERKRPLPSQPKSVAVISSVQAAGYADFIKIVGDRWGGMRIDVANVQVQGAVAADQIIRALNYFNTQESLPEVIIIIRGGGSADDLSVFSDEKLVRAIASSRVPTLVGVGHETDESLADLVADVRAATPSNAAQILVPDKKETIRSIKLRLGSLVPIIQNNLSQYRSEVNRLVNLALDNLDIKFTEAASNLNSFKRLIGQLDPNKALERGYAILRGEYKTGSIIEVETSKFIMKAEVKDVRNK
ncbi:exodeoxyribonuclease VII large subunit [Candidatus Saccharibacteria bacterium]|nr:exodeoxyribonuclease VII large subunit [Candidatus Saccharibacteria bacterium]